MVLFWSFFFYTKVLFFPYYDYNAIIMEMGSKGPLQKKFCVKKDFCVKKGPKKDHFSSLVLKRTKSLIKDLFASTVYYSQGLDLATHRALLGILAFSLSPQVLCSGFSRVAFKTILHHYKVPSLMLVPRWSVFQVLHGNKKSRKSTFAWTWHSF